MSVPGPLPKLNPDGSKAARHRIKSPIEWIEVEDCPFVGYKPLSKKWPIRTRAWWNGIRTMPHARLWGDEEWEFALATAAIHREFWKKPWDMKLAGELRRREQEMGVGISGKRGLRIKYVKAKVEDAGIKTQEAAEEDVDYGSLV